MSVISHVPESLKGEILESEEGVNIVPYAVRGESRVVLGLTACGAAWIATATLTPQMAVRLAGLLQREAMKALSTEEIPSVSPSAPPHFLNEREEKEFDCPKP